MRSRSAGDNVAARRCGDLQRHLALHRENIGELAVVLLRPARLLRDRIDQLDGHSHAAAIDANTAFHQVAGPKLPCDGGAIGVAKPIDRAPAQHAQRRDLRELTANLVGHAFREEALGPVLRQVAERPHRDDAVRMSADDPRRSHIQPPTATADRRIAAATIVSTRDRRRRTDGVTAGAPVATCCRSRARSRVDS